MPVDVLPTMFEKTYRASAHRSGDLSVEVQARDHRIIIDEPVQSGGTDTGMNPVELLLGSIAACQTITLAIYAEQMQIQLDELWVDVEGDMDSAGFMGYDGIRPGYQNIRCHVHVRSDASLDQLDMLLGMMELRCPVEDSVGHGVAFAKPKLTREP